MANNNKIEEKESEAPSDIVAESEAVYTSVTASETDPFDFYYKIISWAVFVGSALIILLYLIDSFEKYYWFFMIDVYYYSLIIEVIIFAYLGFRATPPVLPLLRGGTKVTAKVGAIAGVILGIILAVFKLIWYFKVWTFFNLITEPILTGVMGFLICGAVGWLRSARGRK